MTEERTNFEQEKENEKNRQLLELVQHAGWHIARDLINASILNLQTTSEYADVIDSSNATRIMKEMKANKRAAEILFNWLREIEGGADIALSAQIPPKRSVIARMKDDGTLE